MIGSVIDGRYKVLRLLGKGGMGKVFEAEHTGTGRHVAVKVILSEALNSRRDLGQRFQREARTAGTIDTRHIVAIVDTGIDPATQHPYMAMELMKGDDCVQLLRRVGPLVPEVALRIVAQVCVGLKKAHEAGVIHRDIKPANLFLAEQDEGEIIVKILDFGIAKVKMEQAQSQDKQLTQTGTLMGSPLYMSPEQVRASKSIDHRADIWSLGVVLYQLLCGRTPYQHLESLGDLILAICGEAPTNVQQHAPWVAPEVVQIVHAALVQDPAGRFQTADDMLTAVKGVLPDGHRIAVDDLVGVSEAARAVAADTLDLGKLDTATELVEAATVPMNERMPKVARVTAPQVPAASGKGRGSLKWAAAGLAAALVGGGLYVSLRQSATSQPAAATASASAAPTVESLTFSEASPVVIMAGSFSGYSTFRSASFAQRLARAKVPLKYVDQPDQKKRAAAVGHTADLIAMSLDKVILNRPGGKIVALIDTTIGADAIVLNDKRYPQLQSLSALQQLVASDPQQKPVLSYAVATPSEFLARLLSARLDSFNIDELEIDAVSDTAAVWDKLTAQDSSVAAAVLWEPFVTRARDAGYPVVLSSGDVPGAIQDVLVASDRIISRAPKSLQAIVSAYYRQVDSAVVNPSLLIRQVADDAKLTEEEAKAVVTGIRFATALTAAKAMTGGALLKRLKATASVLVIDGRLDDPLSQPEALFESRFVSKAADNTRALIANVKQDNPKAAKLLSEGGEQHAVPAPVDIAKLADSSVIGQLGQLAWNPANPTANVQPPMEAAADKLSDFSPITTVVVLEGGGGDDAPREQLRLAVEQVLRRRGLMHQVAILPGTGFGQVAVRLVHAPESSP